MLDNVYKLKNGANVLHVRSTRTYRFVLKGYAFFKQFSLFIPVMVWHFTFYLFWDY